MELLDVRQAAEFLKLSPQRIRQLAGDGRIGQKVGQRWVFSLGELEAFAAIPRPTGKPPAEREQDDA